MLSLSLFLSPGDNSEAIEADTKCPRQRGRICRESRHKPLVLPHHSHPLPLVGWFRLFAAQVFRKDVPFGVVPVVFIGERGVFSKL